MSNTDPRSAIPAFYNNPVIKSLEQTPRWSVSDSEKMPINMQELRATGRLWGAHAISEECLFTLPELVEFLPNAANNAYYLQSQMDGFAVLDIEKTCPPEVAAELLKLPGLYAEYSMSGRGYHLVLPLPRNFWDYPIATSKKVLKHEQGWYEILLDHWVTFTRHLLPEEQQYLQPEDPEQREADNAAWDAFYATLAQEAVETHQSDISINAEKPEIVREKQILDLMTRNLKIKTLEDFGGDYSRYEFSTLGVLYNKMRVILVAVQDAEPDAVYDDNVRAWLLYEGGKRILEYRDKHEEVRNGMPLLLNAAVALMGLRAGAESQIEEAS